MKIYSSLVTISLFFIAILIVIFLVVPQAREYWTLKGNFFIKEGELSSKEGYLTNLKKINQRLEEEKESLDKINMALPSQPELPLFLASLEKIASENGLILKDVSSSQSKKVRAKGEKKNLPKEINVSLSLVGTYENFKNFLSTIEKSARLIDVENISFSSEKEKNLFNFELQIGTYFKNYSY